MTGTNWFDVDRAGLAKLAARRNKTFILRELLQNAWDEPAGVVKVEVAPIVNGLTRITVEDDAPEGFADLRFAYTLFAESGKAGNAEQRGRFNLGEKLVLALCERARIITTKGTVKFTSSGRRIEKGTRPAGSMFEGHLRLTEEERIAVITAARGILPPVDKRTVVQGVPVPTRTPVAEFEDLMQTEVAGKDGRLVLRFRKAKVRVYDPEAGETAYLYEMGIPVVPTGDRYHVDVGQKVPLNMERDNVPPGWLGELRALVANATHHLLNSEEATAPWARDALGNERTTAETVTALVTARFGDKAVIFDPSDPEANNQAVSQGYTVVRGGTMTGKEWERVREADALRPAGQVFPTPKPFKDDGSDLKLMDQPTPGMQRFAVFANHCAKAALGKSVEVRFVDDPGWNCVAAFGTAGVLFMSVRRLGHGWFDRVGSEQQVNILIHEFGHHVEGNHLDDRYHDALCMVGARIVRMAIDDPSVFRFPAAI